MYLLEAKENPQEQTKRITHSQVLNNEQGEMKWTNILVIGEAGGM